MTETKTKTQLSSWFGGWRLRLSLESYYAKATVMTYIITFVFLFAVTTTPGLMESVGMYYLLLLLSMLMIGFWFETEFKEDVFPRHHFKINAVPYQVAGGFLLAIGYLLLMLAVGNVSTGRGSDDLLNLLMLNIIVIGCVEGIMILVYVKVVFLGIFVFPFVFAFLHPVVNTAWTAGNFTVQSMEFFAYAVCMAFVFIGILTLRHTLQPKNKKGEPIEVEGPKPYKFFGFISQAVFHGLINVFNVIMFISLGGVALG